MPRVTPDNLNNPEDEVANLGDYYFSKTCQGIMKGNPKKIKVHKIR